jgi:peptidoglycan hydrolase CwlO-like protein
MSQETEENKAVKKAVTWLHLIVAVVSIIAIGFKIHYDVKTNSQAIEELKKKSEKNNETISEIKTNTAVMNVRLESVDNQTRKTNEKVDKIDEKIDRLIINGK